MKRPCSRAGSPIWSGVGLALALAAGHIFVGCGAECDVAPIKATLAVGDGWQLVQSSDDPWAKDRPADLACPATVVRAEFGGTELRTADCGHITVRNTLRTKGTALAGKTGPLQLTIQLAHGQLTGPEGAKGGIRAAIDGAIVLDLPLDLQAEPKVLNPTFTVPAVTDSATIKDGATIHVNVHNHGANAYGLFDVRAVHTPSCD